MTTTPQEKLKYYSTRQMVGLILGPLLFGITLMLGTPEGMSQEALGVLATTIWIAIWWITEAIPIEATALLPIILFPLTGGLGAKETTATYGHSLIFLYLGGFVIALAIERWNLHRRIALNIIYAVGTNASRLILGFMVATGFLSMWISNTATSLMMLPIALAIVRQIDPEGHADRPSPFAKALMLAIAYSASIGGMATLIGTPPNLVFAAVVKQTFGVEITFAQWFIFGVPFSAVLLVICWWYLVNVAFKLNTGEALTGRDQVREQLRKLGKMSKEEVLILIIFGLTAFFWMTRSFLLKSYPSINDTVIALIGAALIFVIPAPSNPGLRLIDWSYAVRLPWGILLLFGGGLALAAGFEQTGLASWLGNSMVLLQGATLILIIAAVAGMVNFLTEITSNLATASMILPILASLALAIGVHPYSLMIPAILAASCAFMLPVATPPNAVVFGSGYLKMGDMIKAGLRMNILTIVLITIYVFIVLPLLWNIDLQTFPANLKI